MTKEQKIEPEPQQKKEEFAGLMKILTNSQTQESDLNRIVSILVDAQKDMSLKTNIKSSHRFSLARVLSDYLLESQAFNSKNLVDTYIKYREIYGVSRNGEARKAIERIGANASHNIQSDDEKSGFLSRFRRH